MANHDKQHADRLRSEIQVLLNEEQRIAMGLLDNLMQQRKEKQTQLQQLDHAERPSTASRASTTPKVRQAYENLEHEMRTTPASLPEPQLPHVYQQRVRPPQSSPINNRASNIYSDSVVPHSTIDSDDDSEDTISDVSDHSQRHRPANCVPYRQGSYMVHGVYTNLVKLRGERNWRELRCRHCGGNARRDSVGCGKEFMKGVNGLQQHVNKAHDDGSTAVEVFQNCRYKTWTEDELRAAGSGAIRKSIFARLAVPL